MEEAQRAESLPPVTADEDVVALIGVEPEKLSDDFDGKDLGVGKPRGGTALTASLNSR
jgi:hypothetical protein